LINQNYWRVWFLAIVGISTAVATVSSLVVTSLGNRSVADFDFPQELELNSGQVVAVNHSLINQEIAKNNNKYGEKIQASQPYQFLNYQPKINLEFSYLVGTRGDVEIYLRNYTALMPIKTKQTRQLEEIGSHLLFTQNHQAYLSSCISPRSLSNVTQQQFSQYRYQNDLQLTTVWQWLQGKASIRDRRCLWILISTPNTSVNSEIAYQSLEQVWRELYQWWLPNFPTLTDQ
jgi:cyanosortase A-associated protein